MDLYGTTRDHFAEVAMAILSQLAEDFTHEDLEATVAKFVNQGIVELGDKLGPILWQFMPTKQFDREDFSAFLALLPDRTGHGVAAAQAGAARVRSLPVRRRSPRALTASASFARTRAASSAAAISASKRSALSKSQRASASAQCRRTCR
mgnify:CR=1 FL=1